MYFPYFSRTELNHVVASSTLTIMLTYAVTTFWKPIFVYPYLIHLYAFMHPWLLHESTDYLADGNIKHV